VVPEAGWSAGCAAYSALGVTSSRREESHRNGKARPEQNKVPWLRHDGLLGSFREWEELVSAD